MGKISLNISQKGARSCGSCTKCCEGWLTATIHGQEMSPGKPCHLVDEGIGCKDYKNRPTEPCKTFSCMWKASLNIPEKFSPEKTGVIVSIQHVNGIEFLTTNYAGKEIQADFLSWFIMHCISRKINFQWSIDGEFIYIGSDEFRLAMDKAHGII
jgi:hypothetical protein